MCTSLIKNVLIKNDWKSRKNTEHSQKIDLKNEKYVTFGKA